MLLTTPSAPSISIDRPPFIPRTWRIRVGHEVGKAGKKINLMMVMYPVGDVTALSPTKPEDMADLGLWAFLVASVLVFAVPGAGSDGGAGWGPEGWWIGYPDRHPIAGSAVEHPSWALEPLNETPVIILVHLTNCPACKRQEADLKKVLADLGDEVAYVDLLYERDPEKSWAGLALYDPAGSPRTVPLTVFLTRVFGVDGSEVAWQSAIGYQGERWIRSHLVEAIRLYAGN